MSVSDRLSDMTRYDFRPTGVASEDQTKLFELIDAIALLPQDKQYRIFIRDTGKPIAFTSTLGQVKPFYANIDFVAQNPREQVLLNDGLLTLQPGGYFSFHDGSTPPAAAGVTFGTWTGGYPGTNQLTGVSMSGAALAEGDFVYITSEDKLPCEPHISGGENRPAEVRRITRVVGNVAEIDVPLDARHSISPRVIRFKAWRGGWFGIRPTCTTKITSGSTQHPWLQGSRTYGYKLEDYDAELSCGYPNFHIAHSLAISDIKVRDIVQQFNDYGVLVGTSCNAKVLRCEFEKVRHAFTTGGWQFGSNIYGCYGITVESCIQNLVGDGVNAYACFDTHPGVGPVIFDRCGVRCTAKDNKTHIAFGGRSPGVVLKNCWATGNVGNYQGGSESGGHNLIGVRPMAADWRVDDFNGEKLFVGIQFGPGNHNEYWDGLTINNPSLRETWTTGILIWKQQGGAGVPNNVKINRGTFDRVARVTNTVNINVNPDSGTAAINRAIKRAAISIWGGSGHRIKDADIPFDAAGNQYSVDVGDLPVSAVSLLGNNMTGYSAGTIGVTSDVGGGSATFDSFYGARNTHD